MSFMARLLPRKRRFWTFWFPWSLFLAFTSANTVAGWCHAPARVADLLSALAAVAAGALFGLALEAWIDERLAKRKDRAIRHGQ